MSPPGKNSGWTTNESVVKATREPPICTIAWSSMRSSTGLENIGRKMSRKSSALRRPPLPCPSTIRPRCSSGAGQTNEAVSVAAVSGMISGNGMASVLVISGAGALGRNHGRAQRRHRRAALAERRTIDRLLQPLQDQRADAFLRFLGMPVLHPVNAFGVKVRKLLAQPVSAPGDLPDAAPLAVGNLEHLSQDVLRGQIPGLIYRTRILIFNLGAPFFELRNQHRYGFQKIERLKPSYHHRHVKITDQLLILAITHYGANVAWSNEALHAIGGRIQNQSHGGWHQHMRNQHGEIRQAFPPGLPHRHAVGGRRRFEADSEKNYFSAGIRPRDIHRVHR